MTYDEFIKKYTGKEVDFDYIYPNQCMDLMHQYVYDVLGLTDKTILAAPTAAQAYYKAGWETFFKKVPNTPKGVPVKGDILFFGTEVGPAGHVCIVIEANVNSFTSFDANWPVGSLPHIQTHNYVGCLGWLHPLVTNPDENQYLKKIVELEDELKKMRESRNAWKDSCKELEKQLAEFKGENEMLKLQVETLQTVIASSKDDLSDYLLSELLIEMLSRFKDMFARK